MKRNSFLPEKSFKEKKLWNYRTIVMFLAISIIIFILLLLVSGCKADYAELVCFTTPPTLELTGYAQEQDTGLIELQPIMERI